MNRKPWFLVGSIAVVLIAILGWLIFTNSNSPTPTPTPTISPTASPTKTSGPTPTITPTPSPTPTKSPTSSPTPTKSPTPSPTPSPEPTPKPVDVISWANTTYGKFSPLTAGSFGDSHVKLPQKATGAIVTVTNNGADDQEFTVSVIDQFGNQIGDDLISVTGDYQGTVGYGLQKLVGSQPTTLLIKSGGAWTVEIAPVSSASQNIQNGQGDDVYLVSGQQTTLTVQTFGLYDFQLNQFVGSPPTQSTIINVSGLVNQNTQIATSPSVLTINSSGYYNLSLQ